MPLKAVDFPPSKLLLCCAQELEAEERSKFCSLALFKLAVFLLNVLSLNVFLLNVLLL